jgi:hypothetical protein
VPAGVLYFMLSMGDGILWPISGDPSGVGRSANATSVDDDGNINILTIAVDQSYVPIAYSWAPDLTVGPDGASGASGPWLPPGNRTVQVTGVPAATMDLHAESGILYKGQAYADYGYVSIPAPPASDTLTFPTPDGVGEGKWVNVRSYTAAGHQKVVTTTASVSFDAALPYVTDLRVEAAGARPTVSWVAPAPTAAADGSVTVVIWGSTPQDPVPPHQWVFVTPPSGGVRAPALPPQLADYAPSAQSAPVLLRHTSVESTAWRGGRDFRAGWLEVMHEGLTREQQRPPPVFGTSFTTRMTETRP